MINTATQLLSTSKFDGLKDKIFPSDVIVIGGFRINDSVISGFIVVFVILLAALILRLTVIRHWKTTPSAAQMFAEKYESDVEFSVQGVSVSSSQAPTCEVVFESKPPVERVV